MTNLFTIFFFLLNLCPIFYLNLIDFYDNKIKSMLPSMKIQNGAQIQGGRQTS
jgi:hypothetical protein